MGSGSVFAGINLCHLEVASPLSGPLLSPLTMKVLNKISSSLSEFAFECGAPAELPPALGQVNLPALYPGPEPCAPEGCGPPFSYCLSDLVVVKDEQLRA